MSRTERGGPKQGDFVESKTMFPRPRWGRESTGDIMKLSWQSRTIMVALLFSLLPFIALCGIVLWPYNPIRIDVLKITNNGPVTLGTPVFYCMTGEKYTDKPGVVIRQLINSRLITYTALDGNVETGPFIINNYLETGTGDLPGIYHMRMTIKYTYFGFWEVITALNSLPFRMVAHHDELKEGKQGKQGKQGKPGKDLWGR